MRDSKAHLELLSQCRLRQAQRVVRYGTGAGREGVQLDLSFIGLSVLIYPPIMFFLSSSSQPVGDEGSNLALEGVEDGEGEGNIHNDSDEARAHAHVEAHNTLFCVDLLEAVSKSIVLVSLHSLHLCLDNIDRVVCHGGAEAREATGKQIDNDLDGDVVAKELLRVGEDDEAHTLV